MEERAIPILPCRSIAAAVAFHQRVGLAASLVIDGPDGYAILRDGAVELHFAAVPGLDPATSSAACYLRVADADEWYDRCRRLGLPPRGVPRLGPIADQPWAMREFALVDPDGNLLRIGTPLATG
jgi:catechol 2,3-dioxygenase-like lactoylglutathione lyase family enzyme